MSTRIQIIDSHTGGEPTRLIIAGGPELAAGDAAAQRDELRARFDRYRCATMNEPRGSDVLVGGILTRPKDPRCVTGIVFFNNVGYLGMCGHGAIGLVATLAHMGRIQPGEHAIETPVGVVNATLHPDGRVSIANVRSYRHAKSITVKVPGLGEVTGDIAWGGNWFFLIENHELTLDLQHLDSLTDYTWRVRQALNQQGVTGANGGEIDHIELFGPAHTPGAHSRNFVLCPGKAYDRSPCGTGTSAKLACLAADGKLREGDEWIQESIIGSTFTGSFQRTEDGILPKITGIAHVNAESTLILNDSDPFCWGIPAGS